MPSSYTSLHYHIVFSTKDRRPMIDTRWQPRLHGYLGAAVRGLDAVPLEIGGVSDHVHLVLGLRPTHCLADVIRDTKKAATRWVRSELRHQEFGWQVGYAAFTISPTAIDSVRAYVANQEEHHRTLTFRDELIALLEKAGIDFDPKYLD